LSIVEIPYVLSGLLNARATGASQLHRAGAATWQFVPADTTVTMATGDSLLFLGVGEIELVNPGTAPTEILGILVSQSNDQSDPPAYLPDVTVHDYELAPPDGIALPDRAIRVQMRRLDLAPEAELPPVDGSIARLSLTLPWNEAGTPVAAPLLMQSSDGVLNNSDTDQSTVYVASIAVAEPAESPTGPEAVTP
jgi:hypothetical protein